MIPSHILLHSLVRGIDLVGMVLLLGGLVFRSLVVSPPSGQPSRLERFLPLLLLMVGLSDLVLRSQMIGGLPLAGVWVFLPTVLFKSHFGKVWMARTSLLCLLGVTLVIKIPKGERVALATCALLLLTASLSGHAADSGTFSLAVLIDWLHLLAISAWTGGLFFLAFFLRKWIVSPKMESTSADIVVSVKRFSAFAGVCVLLILITGSYQVWQRVGSLTALFPTSYGQTLMVKLLLVLPLLGLGALNRYRILPKLSRHAMERSGALVEESLKRLVKIVTLEIALAITVIVCVALLLQLPPARGQLATAYKVSSHPASHLSQGQASPSQLEPAEGAKVKILFPKEGEVFKGDEILVRFKLVKGKRGEHVHAYVDGELMGMFKSTQGSLTGVKPGHHVLEVKVVADDHQTELDATDKVHFVVK